VSLQPFIIDNEIH